MRIVIIGAGPRGMLALERLISWQKAQPTHEKLEINIFDPYSIGGRVWTVDQPYELIMNTASQDITLFFDQSIQMSGPINAGPNLAQWCKDYATDYLGNNNYPQFFLNEVKDISPNDYTSRSLFGIYIRWFYEEQLKRVVGSNITINLIEQEVTDILKNNDTYKVVYDNREMITDIIIASLGNLFNYPNDLETQLTEFANQNDLTYVRPNFANEVKLDNISSEQTVAIRGLGLNFFDLMARFTYGRGGRFTADNNGELTYHLSGNEPQIIAGSRHGLPNHAKGHKQKAPGEEYQPRFLTAPTLKRYTEGSLSYEEFWQMLKNEMSFVYYSTLIDEKYSSQIDKDYFQLQFLQNPELAVSDLNIDDADYIDWDIFTYPTEADTADNFDNFIEAFVKKDFQEADKGTKNGPLTSALEVLRDIRSAIRYVIENELLSKNDFIDKFLGQYNSINNLLSMGPPVSRLKELHALLKSGVIKIIPGEMTVETNNHKFVISSDAKNIGQFNAEALIEARIPKVSLAETNSSLMNHLVDSQLIKSWQVTKESGEKFVSGAIDFDSSTRQLIDTQGNIVTNFYFWGVPTEGKNWLTTASPKPYVNDPSLREIDQVIQNIWNR